MEPRPSEVEVGFLTFKINWLTPEEWKNSGHDAEHDGNTEQGKAIINICLSEGYPEQSLREVLLHEILHACWYVSGLTFYPGNKEKDIEEYLVTIQALELINVLQKNPKVVKYLMETD